MTVVTEPTHGDATDQRNVDSMRLAEAIAQSGDEYVVPADTDLLATADNEILDGPLNAFGIYNTSGLTVTIDTGEAAFAGHYLASDDRAETDPVTGSNVHTVDIPANSTDETIYLAVDRTRTDRIIIDIEENIVLSGRKAPRLAIWDVNSDGSSITATSNRRPLTTRVNYRNARYEGDNSVPVDRAENSQFFRGYQPGQFVRSDQNDILAGTYVFERGTDARGVPGESDGEYIRYAAGTSDFIQSHQGGHGRVAWAWNAYWDYDNPLSATDPGEDAAWRSIVANEPHALIGLNSNYPGAGDAPRPSITHAVAPANDNADEPIEWKTRTIDETNKQYVNGEAMQTIPILGGDPTNYDIPRESAAIYIEDKPDSTDLKVKMPSGGDYFIENLY